MAEDLMLSPIQHVDATNFSKISDASSVEEDVEFLRSTHSMIKAVLHDTEDREILDKNVKLWLYRLKRLDDDAKDILEEYDYEILRTKIEGSVKPTTHTTHGKRKLEVVCDPTASSSSASPSTSFLNHMSSNLRDIKKRFEDIYKQRKTLRLKEAYGKRRQQTPIRPPSGFLINEKIIYGREKDKNKLKKLILMPNNQARGHDVVSVIALVGVGGVGKTTLSQFLYNDEEISKHFDTNGWVCVSYVFDTVRITKEALVSMTGNECSVTQYATIQQKLQNELQGKKFLLVLDDVWNEKQELWDNLRFLLNLGMVGSKILVTTRTKDVACIMSPHTIHNLKALSQGDCWELFRRRAFVNPDKQVQTLVDIGKEIVRKCNGLPLMAKVLGDLLRDANGDVKRWKEMLESDAWKIKDKNGDNNVLATLKLSYIPLPMHMKQCFLYCSVFPKGYEFKRDQLIQLWTAQDFITDNPERTKLAEDIGTECVDGFLRRSFLQQFKNVWGETHIHVHDIMHDLAQSILQEEQSLSSDGIRQCCRSACRFEVIPGRTFEQSLYPSSMYTSREFGELKLVVQLKRLRVLILDGRFRKLAHCIPDSIGELKHLRYFRLWTLVRRLPETIWKLHNLQTLDCRAAFQLEESLEGIGKLKELRHLGFFRGIDLTCGIRDLVHLQTLDCTFSVSSSSSEEWPCNLSELGNLSLLQGELCIRHLRIVRTGEEARAAKLSHKPKLRKLVLDWNPTLKNLERHLQVFDDQKQAMVVLDNLEPHSNLEELEILDYPGVRFPEWLGDPSLNMLTELSLSNCSRCEQLPALGRLQSLKVLHIFYLDHLKQVGLEFYGDRPPQDAFPSLECLALKYNFSLEEWCGVVECRFPRLRKLVIEHCPKLRFPSMNGGVPPNPTHVPLFLGSLQTFKVSDSKLLIDWCRIHAATTLANINKLILGHMKFATGQLITNTKMRGGKKMRSITKVMKNTNPTNTSHKEGEHSFNVGDGSSRQSNYSDILGAPSTRERIQIERQLMETNGNGGVL